jgi:hypothetical protein
MKRLVPLILAAGAAVSFGAMPASGQSDSGPRRVSQLIVYGSDPCPQSTPEEIVVCARRPEDDRYRIPEPLRGSGRVTEQSWAANARSLEMVGRTGIQSCSTVGPGGFTGCWNEMMRQAREDRRTNPEGQPIP